MIARLLIMTALLPLAVHAQIALFAYTGGPDVPVNTVYGYGQIAQGDSKEVVFRARNTGSAAVTITKLAVAGMGFSIVNSSSTPFTIAPGSSLDFTVRATNVGGSCCNATLQVNTLSVFLSATFVPAATLNAGTPCTGPDSQNIVSFGRTQQGGQVTCTFTLFNATTQALTVSPLSLTGAAFVGTLPASPSIPAGQSIVFPVTFSASAAVAFSGSLAAGARTYTLSGTGFSAPLPAPTITLDSTLISSGEQHTLTAKLPQASPVSASGTLTLAFAPTGTAVTDDAAIQFVSIGKRVISFTIAQGSTELLFNGQKNLIFSTGTTAGRITLTFDSPVYGLSGNASTVVTLGQAPVSITTASVTRRANDLDVVISGFDNTYSMGQMSFTFYDASGRTISAPVAADFSSSFTNFFKSQTAGSSFLMRVTFPVSGDSTAVRSVEVSLNNAAGSVKTQKLNFP